MWCAKIQHNLHIRTKNAGQSQIPAKLPNGIPPNYRMKMRQTTERKCAKLPNENAPNYRIIKNILLFLHNKSAYK